MRQWYPDLPPSGDIKDVGSATEGGFVRGGFGVEDPFDDGGGYGGSEGSLFGGKDGGGNSKVGNGDGEAIGDEVGNDPEGDPFEGVDWQAKTDRTPPTYQDYVNWHERRAAKKAAIRPVQNFADQRPASEIGILNRLPGEIRNEIYRLSLVDIHHGAFIAIKMEPNTCAVGKCLHGEARTALPGLLTTCRQIRWEAAAIYFGENSGFTFDDQVVLQGCVPNYLRCIGDYVKEIQQIDFDMKRQRVVPPGGHSLLRGQSLHRAGDFADWVDYKMSVFLPPSYDVGSDFGFEFSTLHSVRGVNHTCACPLEDLVGWMSHRKETVLLTTDADLFDPYAPLPDIPVSEYFLEMVESETFSTFVYRLRRSTGHHGVTDVCPDCEGTDFVSQAPQA